MKQAIEQTYAPSPFHELMERKAIETAMAERAYLDAIQEIAERIKSGELTFEQVERDLKGGSHDS